MINQISDVEKRDKFASWVKLASIGAAALLAGVFYLLLMQTVVAIAALGIAAALGFSIVQLAPWFALKIANLKYRMVEAEKVDHIRKVTDHAAENPIETLTNLLIQKKAAFKEFEAAVTTAVTARSNFKTKVAKFKERYPARAPEFEAQLARMTDLVERKKKALAEAQQTLSDGDMKLEEMKAYYEMSKDAIEANRAAGMDTGDAFEKLKADTACDAVFESMNMAFAQLEVAAALDENSADNDVVPVVQLAHSEPIVIDATVRQEQKVSR